ncbi:MAG: fibronectin type III domain-containing protein [Acidimicrobiales bacterium]
MKLFWHGNLPAPVAMTASYTTTSGKALSVGAPGLLTNGKSYGAIPVLSTSPAHGTASITSDGAFTYTPTAGFVGTDSFKYSETNGHGSSKATVTIHVTPTFPGAPSKPTVTSGNGSVKVTWTAPTDGGSAISLYTVTASGTGSGTGKTCTTTGATSCTVTGLTNGTSYTFKVVAKNTVGTGPASPASTSVTPATVPGAPRTLASSASAVSITVTWAAPLSSGGAALRSYEVFRGTSPGTVGTRPLATVGPTTLKFTDTSAAAGVLYYYEVVATNGVGMSAYSTGISASLISIGALGDRMAGTSTGSGYWIVTATGEVTAYGPAQSYGSISSLGITVHDIVGIAPTPTDKGYWLVGADGGVFAFGDARFYGSMGGKALNQPVVGMATIPTGNGYWLVAADGGIFSFGDARFYGSMGGKVLNQPVVGMATVPTGNGYWLVAADGGVFAFGSAQYRGSMGGKVLNQPITAMTASPTSGGYWLVAADGGVFSFGSAHFFGSTGSEPPPTAMIGLVSAPTGTSYSEVDQAGTPYHFGG